MDPLPAHIYETVGERPRESSKDIAADTYVVARPIHHEGSDPCYPYLALFVNTEEQVAKKQTRSDAVPSVPAGNRTR